MLRYPQAGESRSRAEAYRANRLLRSGVIRDRLKELAEQHRLEHVPKRLHREINGNVDYLRNGSSSSIMISTALVRSSDLWLGKSKLLTSVPGVGPVLCAALLACLPELGRLNRAQAAKLLD